MKSRMRYLTGVSLMGLTLVSACAPQQAPSLTVAPMAPRADVNPGYPASRVELPSAKIPSLSEMSELRGTPKAKGETDEDRLHAPAMRSEALKYGAQGGLAWSTRQVNMMVMEKANELNRTYDFNALLIKQAGSQATLLPPVISESRGTYEQSDGGRTLRVADTYYEIISQARFAPTAPLWQTYLVRSFTPPEQPADDILPKNDAQRVLWRKYVSEGWEQGVKQGQEIFKINLAKLNRDFTGMVRYSQLLETHQVSAPVVANQNLGTTGSGQDMRVDDKQYKITRDPKLNVGSPSQWKPPVSEMDPEESSVPPGEVPGAPPVR